MPDREQHRKNNNLVRNEVYYNVSGMTQYILDMANTDKEAPFSIDDVENLYALSDLDGVHAAIMDAWSYSDDNKNTIIAHLKEVESETGLRGILSKTDIKIIKELCEHLDIDTSDYEEPQQIMEWWICSNHLIEKLKEHGEPVIPSHNLWGRCTSGQAIVLDGVITAIQKETKYMSGD
jgi:hypothetical protein